MADPVAGLQEMARVTRPGGVVAACVWDSAGGRAPLSPFWGRRTSSTRASYDESALAGAREGHLGELLAAAGLRDIEESATSPEGRLRKLRGLWQPFELGVGPAGGYVAGLDDERRAELRERCRRHLPDAPFTVHAQSWVARGVVGA